MGGVSATPPFGCCRPAKAGGWLKNRLSTCTASLLHNFAQRQRIKMGLSSFDRGDVGLSEEYRHECPACTNDKRQPSKLWKWIFFEKNILRFYLPFGEIWRPKTNFLICCSPIIGLSNNIHIGKIYVTAVWFQDVQTELDHSPTATKVHCLAKQLGQNFM